MQSRVTAAMSWETNTTVLPCDPACSIFWRHLLWNSASPTARTSSMTRIVVSRWAATANASRMYIPLE